MSKEDMMELDGVVTEALPNAPRVPPDGISEPESENAFRESVPEPARTVSKFDKFSFGSEDYYPLAKLEAERINQLFDAFALLSANVKNLENVTIEGLTSKCVPGIRPRTSQDRFEI